MRGILAKIWDYIRLLAAGCFFFAVILGVIFLCSFVKLRVPFFLVGVGIVIGFCVLLWVMYKLFGGKEPPGFNKEEFIEKAEKEGLLVATDYKAKRAFQVGEFEDEGIHFYIELDDGSVLFLSGQYLYDYDPESEPEMNSPRRFPCTEFTIKRHKAKEWVVKIECRGIALEPEIVASPFDEDDWNKKRVPEDGEIISDVGYDELKRQRSQGGMKV